MGEDLTLPVPAQGSLLLSNQQELVPRKRHPGYDQKLSRHGMQPRGSMVTRS